MVTINTEELTSHGDVECIGLAGEAFSLQAKCEAVLKVRREAKMVELQAEHERLILERREYGKLLRALETEGGELQRQRLELDRLESKAAFDLRVLRDQKPQAEFALKSEREGYSQEVSEAERKLANAQKRQFDNNAALASWQGRAAKGNERLSELNRQVQGKWDEIETLRTGRIAKRHDSTTGLWNVNGPPLMSS